MEASEEHVGNNAEVIEDITHRGRCGIGRGAGQGYPGRYRRPSSSPAARVIPDDDSPQGVIGTMLLKNGTLAAAYITGLGIGLAGILVGGLAAGGNRRS